VDVLLAQLSPVPGDLAANAARAAAAIADEPGAELAAFPELYLSGYDLAHLEAWAVEPDGEELAPVRAAAAEHRTAVVMGFVERGPGGELRNSAALIDEEGRVAGVYRKVALFGRERDHFAAGERLVVATLAGRRVGPLICFDVEFPELARDLAAGGAELLVTVSANMEPYYDDHELASRARALDNRRAHVYVNRAGAEAGLAFVGGSRVIASDGSVSLELSRREERVALGRVEEGRAVRDAVQYLGQVPERRPVEIIESVRRGTT
jgi:predicted amidohydrolase